MNNNAKHAIDSLIKARKYVYDNVTDQGEVDAIWDGYLTVVGAVYGGQEYPDAKYFIELTTKGNKDEV